MAYQRRKQSHLPSLSLRRYLTYNKESDYWRVDNNLARTLSVEEGVEWGFDLTSVESKKAWEKFLSSHRFTLMGKAPLKKNNATYQPRVYRNPDDVFMVVEHEIENVDGGYDLGYIRFEVPNAHEQALRVVLRDFRGPKIREKGVMPKQQGIAVYVKEEKPNNAAFI